MIENSQGTIGLALDLNFGLGDVFVRLTRHGYGYLVDKFVIKHLGYVPAQIKVSYQFFFAKDGDLDASFKTLQFLFTFISIKQNCSQYPFGSISVFQYITGTSVVGFQTLWFSIVFRFIGDCILALTWKTGKTRRTVYPKILTLSY